MLNCLSRAFLMLNYVHCQQHINEHHLLVACMTVHCQNDSSLVCYCNTVCADIQHELEACVSKCQQLEADKLQLVMFLQSPSVFSGSVIVVGIKQHDYQLLSINYAVVV